MDLAMRRRLFGRAQLLQAFWSFRDMQGLGLLFALEPWLESVHKDPGSLERARRRQIQPFSTNPYMAGCVLGVLCGLEERAASAPEGERPGLEERLVQVRDSLASALAAVGDSFFWGALRPACAAAALLAGQTQALLGWDPAGSALVPATYLALFGTPAAWARWRGLRLGYLEREELPLRLQEYRWQGRARLLRRAGLGAAGAVGLGFLASFGPARGAAVAALLLLAGAALRAAAGSAPRAYGAAAALGCLWNVLRG